MKRRLVLGETDTSVLMNLPPGEWTSRIDIAIDRKLSMNSVDEVLQRLTTRGLIEMDVEGDRVRPSGEAVMNVIPRSSIRGGPSTLTTTFSFPEDDRASQESEEDLDAAIDAAIDAANEGLAEGREA